MKHFLVKNWWCFLLSFLVLMLLFSLPTRFENIFFVLLLLNIFVLVATWVVLLINKEWWKCLLSFVVSTVTVVGAAIVLFLDMESLFVGHDSFGKEHPIPEGLVFHLPQDSYSGNESIDSLDIQDYLQIWNGFQGGIYNYDFYYPSLPAGDIFLRCYEVTGNIPLSKERIMESSTVSIESTHSFSQVVDKKEFTVYEGDWGDYYAARIEVWHRDAKTGEEKKLMDKVYRVEGWMR